MRDARDNHELAPVAIRALFALANHPGMPSYLSSDAWSKGKQTLHSYRSAAAADAIRRGKRLTKELQKHAAEVLRRDAKMPTRGSLRTGPERRSFFLRDYLIIWAVRYLTRG
jgi:hypothetical protein